MAEPCNIYYSLLEAGDERYVWQWIRSIESLRKYNQHIPIDLFFIGRMPVMIKDAADRYGVTVHWLPDYTEYLNGLAPGMGAELSKNPRLHKYLVLEHYCHTNVSQVLYLDSDTYFFGDVDVLFRRYSICSWYAREEPYSKRSHLGYHPQKIDEDGLRLITAKEGLHYIEPYNSGVYLMNNRIWERLTGLRSPLLSYVYRIMTGGIAIPPNNEWIMGQIALWLTLGNMQGLTHGMFSNREVLQNREYAWQGLSEETVLVHYFTNWEEDFLKLLQGDSYRGGRSYAFRKRLI